MTTKRVKWIILLGALYVGMMGAGTCGKNARVQIDSAKKAVDEARAVQAPEYAPTEFQSAENSLLMAQQDFDKRHFQKSENEAKTAEAQARLAQQRALEEKAKRDEAERLRKEAEARAEAERAAATYNVSSLYSNTVQTSPSEEALVALNDVHFDYNSNGLDDSAKQILKMNADWLMAHPGVKVEIEGHCDERGDEAYNLALGAKRAKAVYNYMVTLGVDKDRMRTISYGESMPIDPGHDETAWAANRRVHFAVLPADKP